MKRSNNLETKLNMSKSTHSVKNNNPTGMSNIATTSNSIPSYNSNNNNNTTNGNKKHGFGFGRFSLRRFFNPSSLGRTVSSNKYKQNKEGHENASNADTKSIVNAKMSNRPTCSTSDGESYSISSGRSENYHSNGYMYPENVSSTQVECPLCLLEQPYSQYPELRSCTHRACQRCLQQYLKIEISESRVNIHCPECTEPLHPNDIQKILNYDANLLDKYESFMLRRILVTEPDARWCPAPDCGFVVIASGCASCPKLRCGRPGCETSFCYHCKQEWHPNQTCDAARAQRSSRHMSHAKSSSVSFSHDSIVQRDDIKPCPCCKVPIIKMDDGSCNHMTCSVCGTEFCWLCMKEISDLHYLSPSGCTFWGKKPWSRKKKIMWQMGMLVGAPVGIALIAGIAVPAIIIGIPVWVGRKLHARFERHQMSKHKRNLLVTTGVLTSIFVSPILAAVAVGIGVPILLAYVYGVVPISLCRSGGCGVTTSATGVRIELDEENEIGINSTLAPDGVSVDTAISNRGVNPSIGELSLGMSASVSMGSGSHLDRLAAADRENASMAGCAGSIASGNISLGIAQKAEFQTDISSNKRFSLSSHSETASATFSFGDRSVNISLMDDASVKALAGSIVGYKENNSNNNNTNAITPVEVHVDADLNSVPNKHKTYDEKLTNNYIDIESYLFEGHCQNNDLHNRNDDLHSRNYDLHSRNGDSSSVNMNYIDYYVNYIDENPSLDENSKQGINNNSHLNQRTDNKNRQTMIGKYESRSLEHLSNYCEICHKTHKPCCPNLYSHQAKTSNKIKVTSSNTHKKSKLKTLNPSNDEHNKSSRHQSDKQFDKQFDRHQFDKNRNSSFKINQPNVDCENLPRKKIKRVRSSEYSIEVVNRQNKSVTSFRSTPTSPIESEISLDKNQINKRAYQNSSSRNSKKQQKRHSKDSKPYITGNILEKNTLTLKSSEV